MNYLFVATDVPLGNGGKLTSSEIAERLLPNYLWLLSDAAPLKTHLRANDEVLIYLGGPTAKHFVALCTLAQPPEEMDERATIIAEELGLGFLAWMVRFCEVKRFLKPVPIRPLLNDLEFVTNKLNYGLSLRRPVARIPNKDAELIRHLALVEPGGYSNGGGWRE